MPKFGSMGALFFVAFPEPWAPCCSFPRLSAMLDVSEGGFDTVTVPEGGSPASFAHSKSRTLHPPSTGGLTGGHGLATYGEGIIDAGSIKRIMKRCH